MAYSSNDGAVNVMIYTCLGKGHHFSVPHFSRAYGDTNDRLLFVNAVDFSLRTNEERQKSIVPNTAIPTLLESEPCCSIAVECVNCKDAHIRWEFTGPFQVSTDHSIAYKEMSLYINDLKEEN